MNIDEFINIMESDMTQVNSFLVSFSMVQKYTTALLINDENDDVYHTANIMDMINNNIAEEDLLYIRNSGWVLDEKKENIIKKFV